MIVRPLWDESVSPDSGTTILPCSDTTCVDSRTGMDRTPGQDSRTNLQDRLRLQESNDVFRNHAVGNIDQTLVKSQVEYCASVKDRRTALLRATLIVYLSSHI